MSRAMNRKEREAYLADLHIGVIGIERPGRAPLCVPIWYIYEPGKDIWITIETGSLKEKLLRQAGRFSLCVQDESPPYKYVSGEGPIVSFAASVKEREEFAMASRYLGEKLAHVYVEGTRADPSNRPGIVVTMRPEAWLTTDFAKPLVGPAKS
jgi:nitroimidazol reductase NimA-like FMN-containing flavoprotein (pyridoxamine 5'-phosphate oxidase superfamily)